MTFKGECLVTKKKKEGEKEINAISYKLMKKTVMRSTK